MRKVLDTTVVEGYVDTGGYYHNTIRPEGREYGTSINSMIEEYHDRRVRVTVELLGDEEEASPDDEEITAVQGKGAVR